MCRLGFLSKTMSLFGIMPKQILNILHFLFCIITVYLWHLATCTIAYGALCKLVALHNLILKKLNHECLAQRVEGKTQFLKKMNAFTDFL